MLAVATLLNPCPGRPGSQLPPQGEGEMAGAVKAGRALIVCRTVTHRNPWVSHPRARRWAAEPPKFSGGERGGVGSAKRSPADSAESCSLHPRAAPGAGSGSSGAVPGSDTESLHDPGLGFHGDEHSTNVCTDSVACTV